MRCVVARCTGLLARRAGVVATGVAGRTVVVTAGLTAGRTTVTFGALLTGAGSGRGAFDPVGAASGPADCWAPAGTAVTSRAATTIMTQRKCALAPI